MISRVSRVGAALVASLTVAAACCAAEQGGGPGKGGLGGQIGASTFAIDRALGSTWFIDYSNGTRPRLSFDAHWRYSFSKRWRGQLATGFSWTGYSAKHDVYGVPAYPAPFVDPNFPTDPDKSDYLTMMLPVSLQLQYVGRHGLWAYHLGAGPGAYRVWVENHRKVLKDPVSLKLHRGIYPGGSAEIGLEHYLKDLPNVSLEASVAGHLALSQRPSQFVSGINSNVMATEFRFGGNYYFTPGPRKAPAAAPKSP
jgi:hypothetical protein